MAASTDSEAVEHGGGLQRAGRPAMFPDMAWVEVEGDGVPLALATADRHDGGTWVAIFRWVHPAHRGAG